MRGPALRKSCGSTCAQMVSRRGGALHVRIVSRLTLRRFPNARRPQPQRKRPAPGSTLSARLSPRAVWHQGDGNFGAEPFCPAAPELCHDQCVLVRACEESCQNSHTAPICAVSEVGPRPTCGRTSVSDSGAWRRSPALCSCAPSVSRVTYGVGFLHSDWSFVSRAWRFALSLWSLTESCGKLCTEDDAGKFSASRFIGESSCVRRSRRGRVH